MDQSHVGLLSGQISPQITVDSFFFFHPPLVLLRLAVAFDLTFARVELKKRIFFFYDENIKQAWRTLLLQLQHPLVSLPTAELAFCVLYQRPSSSSSSGAF